MKNELRTGAVHLHQEEQYQLRKSIIRLGKGGKAPKEIAEILDVSLRHAYTTQKAYNDGGIAGIKVKVRGRRTGEKRKLTPEQEREIQQIIVDKTPDQLRFKQCMWSHSNIRDLIQQKCKTEMPLSTMGYYLMSTEQSQSPADKPKSYPMWYNKCKGNEQKNPKTLQTRLWQE